MVLWCGRLVFCIVHLIMLYNTYDTQEDFHLPQYSLVTTEYIPCIVYCAHFIIFITVLLLRFMG